MSHIHTDDDLGAGMAALVASDQRLAAVLAMAGMPKLRRRPAGFPGLCAIVCGQQLSTASAAAIWGRLAAAFDPMHHDSVRQARQSTRLGLSKPNQDAQGNQLHSKGHIDLEASATCRPTTRMRR